MSKGQGRIESKERRVNEWVSKLVSEWVSGKTHSPTHSLTHPLCFILYTLCLIAIFTVNTHAQYNGECWAADFSSVLKISASGQPMQVAGFIQPLSLSIDPNDGSCWVADTDAVRVKKLSATGQELVVLNGSSNPPVFKTQPRSVSVDPRDGSCWVAVFDKIYKFSSDAKKLFELGGLNEPVIAVNPTNGECWVADSSNARVVRLSAAGKQLSETATAGKVSSPSVNPADGSCWVLDTDNHKILKFSSAGKLLVEASVAPAGGIMASTSVSAATDGGCWAAIGIDMMNDQVLRFSADGKQVLKVEGFSMPYSLVADPKDGGCWVADTNLMDPTGGKIVKLSSSGQIVSSIGGLTQPKVVTVAYPVK